MKYIFKNKTFGLREYQKGDAESIAENASDRDIARNTIVIPYPYTLEEARKWVKYNVRNYKNKNKKWISFAIEVDGIAVGSIAINEMEANHKGEMGYWLGKKYRGRGIMSYAVKEFTDYVFKNFKLKRIYAGVFLHNKASVRVLEKAGFKLEGLLKKDLMKDGKYIDHYLYAKVK